MSRRVRKKKTALNRATPMSLPGSGGLIYVPPGALQSTQGQVFYGSSAKNIATGQSALFSPGIPLQPQKNVNPGGYPVQWRFPVAVNTFTPDRALNDPERPSFQQLRSLAKLYEGVTLCERTWLDLVPRMQLKISLKPEYVAAGADDKDYQEEISYFYKWFESPDKMHDQHSWIRLCLREQTQIDELYIYKRKKRGGGLFSLEVIAGDQFKPLLDDWGKIPQPPNFAFQQYPWGLPGEWFTTDDLIHYQESPAADNPFGESRVERVIMRINQALRKEKKDLSHFTEGNIPQGMMKVPADATWTPDQIDAFEQAWNALLAGNASQQVRMRFTQPGMEYQPFEQYALDTSFDMYIFKICCGAYGVSPGDVAFTEDIHKSSGDSQQNMLYRRTIDPLARVYASFFTQCMNNDFDPDLHGDMFEASFVGFEEQEDTAALAGAYSTLTNSGILGISNAGKLLKLPEDPNAPYIGRVILSKTGPIFLDEIASGKMPNPADTQQSEDEEEDDEETPNNAGPTQKKQPEKKPSKKEEDEDEEEQPEEKRYTIGELVQLLSKQVQAQTPDQENGTHFARSEEKRVAKATNYDAQIATLRERGVQSLTWKSNCTCDICQQNNGLTRALSEAFPSGHVLPPCHDGCDCGAEYHYGQSEVDERAVSAEYRKWRQRAIDDVKASRVQRGFTTTLIPANVHKWISDELVECTTPDQVRDVFNRARDTSFLAGAVESGGNQASPNLLWRNRQPVSSSGS